MTSNLKVRRRRTRRSPIWRRAGVALACLGVLAVVLYAFATLTPTRADPADARASLARSLAYLKQDNATAARTHALAAVGSDPDWGLAYAVLARSYAALGEGIAAEGALRRAADAGFDTRRTQQILAEAILEQGDARRALVEVEKTAARFRPYGLRVRARALTALGDYAGARASLNEAVRVAPDDSDVWADLGRFRLTAGDLVGAIAAADRALQLRPGNLRALVLRGELVRNQYGMTAALPWFETALKRDQWDHDALIEYAATLGEAGRTTEMLAAVRKAMEARPESPQGYYLQAVLAARARNYELARALVQRTDGAIDDLPGMLLLQGALALQEGGYQQAVEKLDALVGMQPMNIAARRLLANALMRVDASRNALDVLKPVAVRGDADSYTLTMVARAFERIDERGYAALYLNRAAAPLRTDPPPFGSDDSLQTLDARAATLPDGDPDAAIPLLRKLTGENRMREALALAQRTADENPGAPGAAILVGDVLMLMDRPADAVRAYRQAADIRFDEPTMLRLVEAQEAADDRNEAARTLALFRSQNPLNVAALRLSAHWQIAAGEFDAALTTLELLRTRLGNGDAALHSELALAYLGDANIEAARDHAEAAYYLSPMNPAVADTYGWVLHQGGDLEGARQLLQKAVAIAPKHAMLRWHLAQTYAALNRKGEARAQAQAALSDPAFPDRAAARAMLASG